MSQNKFVRYDDFELAYRNNHDLDILSEDFDLLFVLLLDSSHKQQFFKYDLEIEELFRGYSYGLRLNESTVGFVTQITDIKKVFDSKFSMNKVFNCISDATLQETKLEINYPIYIKQNTAIVKVLTNNVSDIYYFKLHKGVVQINWLGGTIE
jgi:hypothetical protein